MKKRRFSIAVLCVSLSLFLTGCGGSSSSASTPTSGGAPGGSSGTTTAPPSITSINIQMSCCATACPLCAYANTGQNISSIVSWSVSPSDGTIYLAPACSGSGAGEIIQAVPGKILDAEYLITATYTNPSTGAIITGTTTYAAP